MDAKKAGNGERFTYWSQVILERKESGMTVTAYCKSAGLRRRGYYYWQKKLRECAYPGLSETANTTKLSKTLNKPTGKTTEIPNGWAVCEVSKSKPQSASIQIEIGQCRINAGEDINPELLAKVCRVLVAL
jgi:hypothetical protein